LGSSAIAVATAVISPSQVRTARRLDCQPYDIFPADGDVLHAQRVEKGRLRSFASTPLGLGAGWEVRRLRLPLRTVVFRHGNIERAQQLPRGGRRVRRSGALFIYLTRVVIRPHAWRTTER
jgi:hypothetical protein